VYLVYKITKILSENTNKIAHVCGENKVFFRQINDITKNWKS
jgi:hypothetical protein